MLKKRRLTLLKFFHIYVIIKPNRSSLCCGLCRFGIQYMAFIRFARKIAPKNCRNTLKTIDISAISLYDLLNRMVGAVGVLYPFPHCTGFSVRAGAAVVFGRVGRSVVLTRGCLSASPVRRRVSQPVGINSGAAAFAAKLEGSDDST